jgi:hypothetical protein
MREASRLDTKAVIFSDESECIFQAECLHTFAEHEHQNAQNPLPEGPFYRPSIKVSSRGKSTLQNKLALTGVSHHV